MNCLNHIADRAVGGPVDFDMECKYEYVQAQAQYVMNSLVLPHSWRLYMNDGTTPLLAGLQQQIDNWRLVTYLQGETGEELR